MLTKISCYKYIYTFIFLGLLITSIFFFKWEISTFGIQIFKDRIFSFFEFQNTIKIFPNRSLIDISFQYLWITIKTAMVGTTIGFILALFSSAINNRTLNESKWVSTWTNILLDILRIIPTIFVIYFFSTNFLNELSLVLIYSWFSWLWCHKYISNYLSSINYNIVENSKYYKNNKFESMNKYIYPQIKLKLVSLFLYSFESNVKWTSILGFLGLPGIGTIFYYAYSNEFSCMGIPTMLLVATIILLELLIFLIDKKFLICYKLWDCKKTFYLKKIIIYLFFFIGITILALGVISINWENGSIWENNFIKSFFNPNWDIINQTNFNFFFDFFSIVFQSIQIMFFSIIYLIFFCFFSIKFFWKKSYLLIIIFNGAIRSFPTVVLLFLINPIFKSPISTIIVLLSINVGSILTKNLSNTINSRNEKLLYSYKLNNFSKVKMFNTFIFSFKKELIKDILFNWESLFLVLVTYGKFGCSILGSYIDIFYSPIRKEVSNMSVFVWISFFMNISILGISNLIFYSIFKEKY